MGDDAAPAAWRVVAAALDDHDIAGTNELGEVVKSSAVGVRESNGDGGAGDPLFRQHGPQFAIDEAGMQEMADRRGLDFSSRSIRSGEICGGIVVDDEHLRPPQAEDVVLGDGHVRANELVVIESSLALVVETRSEHCATMWPHGSMTME